MRPGCTICKSIARQPFSDSPGSLFSYPPSARSVPSYLVELMTPNYSSIGDVYAVSVVRAGIYRLYTVTAESSMPLVGGVEVLEATRDSESISRSDFQPMFHLPVNGEQRD